MENLREEKTFVLIKPDGVQKGLIGEIVRRFEQRDLKIVALEMFQPTYEEMDNHYPRDTKWITRLGEKLINGYAEFGWNVEIDHGSTNPEEIGPRIRTWLIEYMVSAPLVKMIVEGPHAIGMVRKIVGQTMPYKAEMGTIRGDYSNDSPVLANHEYRVVHNIIHASENQEEATHEIEHWFSNFKGFEYSRR